MYIKITDLNGTEILNKKFNNLSVDGDIYSITFSENELQNLSLETGKLYNIIFSDENGLMSNETYIMTYMTYHYNVSTSFMTDENGNQIETLSVNSNTITLKKF